MKEKDRIITLNPAIIRFTHSKIRPKFSGNGYLIQETINQLETNQIDINDIPLIQIMYINGEYYSMNNRRLFTFKYLQKIGKLNEISARLKIASKKECLKYTRENCALEAKIMKE
jgi:hypothetical protein